MIVSLTGFMGCGKTSIGRELAGILGWRRVDLDALVEQREGRSIREIFSSGGEAAFREAESRALRSVLDESENIVLSLGGGTILDPANAALISSKTTCIYLEASPSKLAEWLEGSTGRPLLSHPDSISLADHVSALLSSREERYLSVARHTINTDRLTFQEAAHIISVMIRTA